MITQEEFETIYVSMREAALTRHGFVPPNDGSWGLYIMTQDYLDNSTYMQTHKSWEPVTVDHFEDQQQMDEFMEYFYAVMDSGLNSPGDVYMVTDKWPV